MPPFPQSFPWDRIAYRHAVFAWCLRVGRQCLRRERLEQALQWGQMAAGVATLDCLPLVYPELEAHLREIAARLPVRQSPRRPAERQRWLHVTTIALPYGGHTAMLRRWIDADGSECRHSVALLEQTAPVPERLAEAVRRSGGELLQLDQRSPLIDRAVQLRDYARQEADVVVLHIYPYDVVPVAALGVAGGPAVVCVNHAAHAFWLGASICDFVLNCGSSPLDDAWSAIHRGVGYERCLRLPIPLEAPPPDRPEHRAAARHELGIPDDALVVLTVGNTFKYALQPGLDFLAAASAILAARPAAYLLAVGVDEDDRWKALREASGGRLRALGKQYGLQRFHQAADVYAEGFPFGSATALLEAGLSGLPCVRSPEQSPLPFGSDGAALDDLPKPADVTAYVREVLALLDRPAERRRQGEALARAIREHHCGPGWRRYLEKVKGRLPCPHQLYPCPEPPPVAPELAAFWGAFSSGFREDELVDVVREALRRGLRPKVDLPLVRVILGSRCRRSTNGLLNLLLVATGLVARIAPRLAASSLWYNDLFLLFRNGGLIDRLLARLIRREKPMVLRNAP